MIAAWMLYSVALGVLLTTTAHVVERSLRLYGRPARFVWFAAIVGSVLLPVWAWVWSRAVNTGGSNFGQTSTSSPFGETAGSIVTPAAWVMPGLNGPLLTLWVSLTAVLVAVVLASWSRLRRERHGWREGQIDTAPILWSTDVGPAVVGMLRNSVVLPQWALGLDTQNPLPDRTSRTRARSRAGPSVVAGVACRRHSRAVEPAGVVAAAPSSPRGGGRLRRSSPPLRCEPFRIRSCTPRSRESGADVPFRRACIY